MSIYLEIKLGWDYIVILFISNYLYKTYYIFQKESRYVVIIEK